MTALWQSLNAKIPFIISFDWYISLKSSTRFAGYEEALRFVLTPLLNCKPSERVSTGLECMAFYIDQCRAQTKTHCLLSMICRRLKGNLLKIIVIMQMISSTDPPWVRLDFKVFDQQWMGSYQVLHTLSPGPPYAKQDGWLRSRKMSSQKKACFFVYSSVKLTSPHKSQTSDSAFLGTPLVWHCTLQDILLATNFPIFKP